MEKIHNVVSVNILTALVAILSLCSRFHGARCFIGVNWGRQNSQRLIPSMVVDLLLQNNIRNIKIYSPSENVLQAFANSGINISCTVPNESLNYDWTPDYAIYWLDNNVGKYKLLNININYLYVGSEPYSFINSNATMPKAVDAMETIQGVVISHYNTTLHVVMSHFTDVLKTGFQKPSEAEFRDDIKDKMHRLLVLLNRTDSPFVMDLFPILSVYEMKWDPEFAFIDNRKSDSNKIVDGDLVYRNVFEFLYDSFLHAMHKEGMPDLKLMVGQVGWPTDGVPGADAVNAERFFRSFLPYVVSRKGTPLRPGIDINIFVHNLVDENKNKIKMGFFQRHWGVYMANGEPKYKIDFTGQARDVYPTMAKGVVRMPQRWCVYNGMTSNLTSLNYWVNTACNGIADCTSVATGGSCGELDFAKNISYIFNMYFQEKAQTDGVQSACDFDGLGQVVFEDPSVGKCKFPIGILSAEKKDSFRSGAISITFSGTKRMMMIVWTLVLTFCFVDEFFCIF